MSERRFPGLAWEMVLYLQAKTPMAEDGKKILFLCVGNTCRSQMAEGLARLHGKGRFEIRSAGTNAMGYVNADTAGAMLEAGVDISAQSSKQLTYEMLDWADIIVTLGCGRAQSLCPAVNSAEKHDWPIEDPLGRPPEVMRRVRDDMERRVKELLDGK